MAGTKQAVDMTSEYCPSCGQERPHDVSLRLVTESRKETNAAFSREPYRVSECQSCGRETELRMNDA